MTSNATLAPGMRVLCRDAEWLVTRVEPSDHVNEHHAIHCVGVDDLVRGHERIFLTQLDRIDPVDPRLTQLVEDTSSGYRQARLFLEAQLRQMPVTDPEPDLERMGAFTPLGYQKEAVHRALLQMRPRLLLADDVGLGKTIEVGMILTELMRRGRADRILVLAKKSMLTQFQAELWNRFAIPLVRLDSTGIAKLRLRIPASKNPFEVYHRIIISIDTLKDVGRYRHFLEQTRWDAVVIDEAHNVAGASVPERHRSYRLARLLSRSTDSLILTTATPHNGKRETFGRLISLLDPSAIPDPQLREYSAEDIKSFFLMRFKEDVRAEAGDNFATRQVVPLEKTTVSASPVEEAVYDLLAELRQEVRQSGALHSLGKDQTWQSERLVQYGLYKLFLSSPEACRATAQGRAARLKARDPKHPELAYLSRLDSALAGLDIASSSRYRLLKRQLLEIGWDGSPRSPRVLIFTESRRTQDALAAALAREFKLPYSDRFEDQAGQKLAVVHGGMPDIHLMKTVEAFGTGSAPMRLLIATDVASEGINLHHECHNIVHWDLPWSIITLIQRNGRVDRFGQKRSPVLRYLMVNTQQGLLHGDREIFERLVAKVEEINRSTRSGESVLKLYDPEAEEEHIAREGILAGNTGVLETPAGTGVSEASSLESLLLQATHGGHEDYLKYLMGEVDEVPAAPPATGSIAGAETSRLRLYGDRRFLVEGYRHLAELNREYLPLEELERLMLLNAPADLRRRLGDPSATGDVVFGATAIPEEAWPEHGQFRLTDDPDHANLAIQAARQSAGHRSRELFCTEQHPILQWIAERLVMLVPRGKAPCIRSPHLTPREWCFCFIGQVSSRAGRPLVVDAHAITFGQEGHMTHRSLREALSAARLEDLANVSADTDLSAGQLLLRSAVEASMEHMQRLQTERKKQLMPLLRKEERRLRQWSERRRDLLERRIADLPPGAQRRRWENELREMEQYLKDRQENWRDTHFTPASEPTTRLVLAIRGGA